MDLFLQIAGWLVGAGFALQGIALLLGYFKCLPKVREWLRWGASPVVAPTVWVCRFLYNGFCDLTRYEKKFSWRASLVLCLLPFGALYGLYMHKAYDLRYQEQQRDGQTSTASSKLMPLPSEVWSAFKISITEHEKTGGIRLFNDTYASFYRFACGMALVSLGMIVGMYMGTFPIYEKLGNVFVTFLDLVPPMLLLFLLILFLDVGETSKIALVFIGVFPGFVRDAYQRAKEISREQFVTAQSLGYTQSEIAWNVVFPQILPAMIGSLRLNFKAAWGFVIASEAIAASTGIGYRVFIMKRYVAVDTILAYVLWATLIMFVLDVAFRWLESRFKWAQLKGV